MLSLIICSINPSYLQQVKENISSTIGAEYELLVCDNRDQKKGLCEVYNKMAAQATFPYLCFLHEDILFETQNWGRLLIKVFEENEQAGVVGIAGGKYKAGLYSGWFTGKPGLDFINITHRINGVDDKLLLPANDTLKIHEVVCVDGVLIACRNHIWKQIKFNEEVLKGFHFYDIDFSLRASLIAKVFVTLEIDIIHITKGGDYGNNWIEAAIVFHEKNKIPLPHFTNDINDNNIEIEVAKQWLDFLKKEKILWSNKMKWINDQNLFKYSSLYYAILKFLLYQPLHLSAIHKRIKK